MAAAAGPISLLSVGLSAFGSIVKGEGQNAADQFQAEEQDRAAQYPILGNGRSAKLGWQMQDYNPAGAAGNAAAATAEKGRAVIDAAGLQLALLLQEVARLSLTTLVEKPDLR